MEDCCFRAKRVSFFSTKLRKNDRGWKLWRSCVKNSACKHVEYDLAHYCTSLWKINCISLWKQCLWSKTQNLFCRIWVAFISWGQYRWKLWFEEFWEMWFIQPNHFIGKHRRCLPLDYIPQKSTDSRYFVKSLQVVRVYTHMWTNVMWQKILFSTAVNYRDVNVVGVLKCVAVNSSGTVSYMFGVFHIHWHSWQLRHTITNSLILRRVCFNKVLDYTPNYI